MTPSWKPPLLIAACSPIAFVCIMALISLYVNLSDDPGAAGYFFYGALLLFPAMVLSVVVFGAAGIVRYLRREDPQACDAGLRRQAATEPPTCPACGAKLVQAAHDDLILDVCRSGCGGIWFDNHELRRAVETVRSIDTSGPLQTTASGAMRVDPGLKRACPRCDGIRMLRRLFDGTCHMEIDECPSCGGIWLDHGEFEQIQELSAHGNADADANAPVSGIEPEAAILMARAEAEMAQSRQSSRARLALSKFIGRHHHTGQL